MNTKNFKKAFTLAEMLLAISIIGFLFIISINSLNYSMEDREKKSQLMKVYPILDNLINFIVIQNMNISNVPFGQKDNFGNDKFAQLLVAHLRVGEDCQNTTTTEKGCWPNKTINGINFNADTSFYKLRLVDGTSLAIKTNLKCNNYESFDNTSFERVCAIFYVDINSHEPPNEWGKDVFAFVYNIDETTNDATFKPASQAAREIIENPKETRKE